MFLVETLKTDVDTVILRTLPRKFHIHKKNEGKDDDKYFHKSLCYFNVNPNSSQEGSGIRIAYCLSLGSDTF